MHCVSIKIDCAINKTHFPIKDHSNGVNYY